MADITYNVTQRLGVLSENKDSGWTKEANMISWNGNPEKLDVRDWNPGHSKSSKGITLTKEEAWALLNILEGMFRG